MFEHIQPHWQQLLIRQDRGDDKRALNEIERKMVKLVVVVVVVGVGHGVSEYFV